MVPHLLQRHSGGGCEHDGSPRTVLHLGDEQPIAPGDDVHARVARRSRSVLTRNCSVELPISIVLVRVLLSLSFLAVVFALATRYADIDGEGKPRAGAFAEFPHPVGERAAPAKTGS